MVFVLQYIFILECQIKPITICLDIVTNNVALKDIAHIHIRVCSRSLTVKSAELPEITVSNKENRFHTQTFQIIVY